MKTDDLPQIYKKMFAAQQKGDVSLAEKFKAELEQLRTRLFPKPSYDLIQEISVQLPEFAKMVLDKNHVELGREEKSNCINAAFNFHDQKPHWETYSTMDFLSRVQVECIQLENSSGAKWGDLAVLWSRTGGSWDGRAINVHAMNSSDADFPYGLVFDHITIRLREDLVFHKPDSTLESRYQIDFLGSVAGATAANQGFEMTFHRRSKRPD